MTRQETHNKIVSHLKNYNPEMIGLFGSYVRGEESGTSDIDILIRFQETYSLLQLIKMENELSEILGVKVDLVTEGSLKNDRIKNNIYQDLLIIYKV